MSRLESVIERMRAAKIEADKACYDLGRAYGYQWACEVGTPGSLELIEKFRQTHGNDPSEFPFDLERLGIEAELVRWKPIVLQGFVDGALALWAEVRDQL